MPKPYVKWSERKRLEQLSIEARTAKPKRKRGRPPKPPKPARAPRVKRVEVTSVCRICEKTFVRLGRAGIFCSRSCQSTSNARANLVWERAVSAKMELDGWTMFTPSSCCDRIGIKNGKLFFVEFKPEGRTELRHYQKLVKDVVPKMYQVVVATYGDNANVEIKKVNGRLTIGPLLGKEL